MRCLRFLLILTCALAPLGAHAQGVALTPGQAAPAQSSGAGTPGQFSPAYAPAQGRPPQFPPAPAQTPVLYYVPVLVPGALATPPTQLAPPPVYVLVPAPQALPQPRLVAGPSREQLYDELQRVESRLASLPRVSVGGPIALMVIGYATAFSSSLIALSAYAEAQDIQHQRLRAQDSAYDINGDGRVNGRDEQQLRHLAYGFTAAAAVGLTTGMLANMTLRRRTAKRRAQTVEKRNLLQRRDSLRRQLDYGMGATPQQMQFSLRGRF